MQILIFRISETIKNTFFDSLSEQRFFIKNPVVLVWKIEAFGFWFIQITQHANAPKNVAHMWVLTDITIIKNKFINSGWSVRWVMAGIYGWVLRGEKERRTCNYRVRLMGAHQKLILYDENNFRISEWTGTIRRIYYVNASKNYRGFFSFPSILYAG